MRPGDFYLTRFGGLTGLLLTIAQALTGDLSRYLHAGIYLGDGRVIAAHRGGARIYSVEKVMDERPLAVSRNYLTLQQRADIVKAARDLAGRPYGYLDYLSLALVTLRIRPKWLLRYVEGTGHLICSQLVDVAYQRAGVHLFADGRPSGDVTPGDLAHVGILEHLYTGPYVKVGSTHLGT